MIQALFSLLLIIAGYFIFNTDNTYFRPNIIRMLGGDYRALKVQKLFGVLLMGIGVIVLTVTAIGTI